MKSRTSWREKLERLKEPKIVDAPGGGTMVIPRGIDVDAAIRAVAAGHLITIGELRAQLARDCGTDTACPLVTGIMVRIAAELGSEEEHAGKQHVAPYCRVVKNDGGLMEKLPGGRSTQARRLAEEGWSIAENRVLRDYPVFRSSGAWRNVSRQNQQRGMKGLHHRVESLSTDPQASRQWLRRRGGLVHYSGWQLRDLMLCGRCEAV